MTCQNPVGKKSTDCVVMVILHHHGNHVPYYDVKMPDGASDIICESLEWTMPVTLVLRTQALYPSVSANQVHATWTKMSEALWREDDQQLV